MTRLSAAFSSFCFLLVAPGVVAGLVPWWLTGWKWRHEFTGATVCRPLGLVLVFACTPLVLDSFARFAWQGHGTPAPVLPTKRLVVSGLYRWVRNPMYVGVVGLLAGQSLLLGSPKLVVYAAAVWTAFHLFVVFYEEPVLRRSFGAEYEAFCVNVPRWLPRRRPWRPA